MRIILLSLVLRILLAFYNGFISPLPGADGDALDFHRYALYELQGQYVEQFETFTIGWVYAYILYLLYNLFIEHIFTSSLFSCLVWLISAILFERSLDILGISKKGRKFALIYYCFMPTSLLFNSVPLREPFQLMFVNLFVLSGLKLVILKKINYIPWIVFAFLGMSIMHNGLIFWGAIATLITIYFFISKENEIFSFKHLLVILPILFIPGLLVSAYAEFTGYEFTDGFSSAVNAYQQGHLESRTIYASQKPIESFFDLIIFIPKSFLQYMLEPMPWKISAPLDLALFLENVIRIFFIISSFGIIFSRRYPTPITIFYMIFLFLTLELIWAMGTVNWGTAARHHVPAFGMLCLLFGLSSTIKDRLSKIS